jgi:hypothetical protein
LPEYVGVGVEEGLKFFQEPILRKSLTLTLSVDSSDGKWEQLV